MPLTITKISTPGFLDAAAALRTDFEKYLVKTASQFRVLDSMKSAVEEPEESDQYFMGTADEGVVALLIVSGGMSKKIDELVAKKGYGGKMVEFAMTLCNGVASLDSFDTDSTGFWGAMGFVKYAELPAQASQGGCKMRLNCNNSEKWGKSDGRWGIVKPSVLPPGFRPREPQPYSGLGVGRKENVWG